MIDEFCGFCDDAFTTLLDAYQMKEWGMSLKEFLRQAEKEFSEAISKWESGVEE